VKPGSTCDRPVAYFEDIHEKRGTTNDRLRARRDSPDSEHLHHPEASGGRPAHPVKRTYRAWTDNEDLQIARLYKHGYTIRQIAEELDRTWQSTNKRLIRLREQDPSIPYSQNKGRHQA
jgi:hypothetical protein